MEITVRRGKPEDVPWILSQLKIFSPLYGTKRSLFGDEDYAREGLLRTMESHLLLVAERGETLMGFVAGMVSPHLYNPAIRILCELFWWVAEEYRKTRAGYLLMREYMTWGKSNVDWMTFCLMENSPVKDGTLRRLGFKPTETSYLMEVQPWQPSQQPS